MAKASALPWTPGVLLSKKRGASFPCRDGSNAEDKFSYTVQFMLYLYNDNKALELNY